MGKLREAINENKAWGYTWNGCPVMQDSLNKCLNMFARAGAMRNADEADIIKMFREAYQEDALAALRLLFYTRDIRGGYGEKNTSKVMLRELANIAPDTLAKNFWAILEFGCAKDFYCLIGTPVEESMWKFIKNQLALDLDNMHAGKSVSLIAKWLYSPNSHSKNSKALGVQTALNLGYTRRNLVEFRKVLSTLREYIGITEKKMCDQKWDTIEYAKVASKCMLKFSRAFREHDAERYAKYLESVNRGEEKINTGTLTPVDILARELDSVWSHKTDIDACETLWANQADVVEVNALTILDTSGSMTCGIEPVPLRVGAALAMYFAERNKGDLANVFMTFSDTPQFVEITGRNLCEKYQNIYSADWGWSTNLEGALNLLLKTCINGKVPAEDMPAAIIIISDMQINSCVQGVEYGTMTFYDKVKADFEAAGYTLPHVVFWNVNAKSPAFHARKGDAGVSMVSGYSTNVFKQVMDSLGSTPIELMLNIINSDRYAKIEL